MSSHNKQLLATQQDSSATIVGIDGGEYKIAEPSEAELKYFASTEGVVHVFDFDYAAITENQVRLNQNINYCFPCGLPCWFMCMKQSLIDTIRARHVAITVDGIRFVEDQHKVSCFFFCFFFFVFLSSHPHSLCFSSFYCISFHKHKHRRVVDVIVLTRERRRKQFPLTN